ncbi:MAG: SDR family oxidoreductase [Pseudobutyrivibrio sp.]|nr:SDR family oxidoreductase [Pseudobutyrivibrio sp.]
MKTALITGATSGIGREFAKQLADEGYKLIVTGRRLERLEELRDSLSVDVEIIPADLDNEEACFNFLEAIKDKSIDIFINNAGFGLAGSFLETDINREISMIKVNDIAMQILFKGILQKMAAQGYGYILNVASSAGLLPGGPYMATYYASKAYVTSLTRAVRKELKDQACPVRVSALCPGPVDTEFNQNADVVFALKGISAEFCVKAAISGMKRNKTIIVPGLIMSIGMALNHLLPIPLVLSLTGRQQKKKLYR